MKKYFVILLFACMGLHAAAESVAAYAALNGKVTDANDGAPLIGVTIQIAELSQITVTDIEGKYAFHDLPKKNVTVQVSYVGHQTIIKNVDLNVTEHLDFVLHESNAMINEVVVSGIAGSTLLKESPTPVSIVSLRDLQTTSSTNIIDAIARKPGLAQITTGSGISKPVIRGLGYNRIVTVNDGIRQEGQQWGDEHGIEIDPQSVRSIEILKGPASLMYGSDAMAGVVIFHGNPIVPEGKIQGAANVEYQTNNGLIGYSVNMGGNQSGFVWNARYSGKHAHAYKNKYDGKVLGSQFRENAANAMLGINKRWGFSHLNVSYYHLTPSLAEGERDEATGAFIMPVCINGEAKEKVATEHDLNTYGHGFPYQQIHHYKAVLDNSIYIGEGTMKLLLGYQQNRRQEFEEVEAPDECGLDFLLHSVNYDARYAWQNETGWKMNTGVGGMYQRSINKGEEYLIPEYILFDIGAYATTGYNAGRWSLNGGLRYDHRHLHSFALEDRFDRFKRSFDALTGSVGAVYEIMENMRVRLNMARGFRAPNLSELGSNGEHEGTFRYEVGNSQLRPEYSWQADAGWDYTSPVVSAQVSVFANFIDNFIFAHRLPGVETDGLPTFKFTQGDARLIGAEVSVDVHPVEPLHFENSFSYVNAVQLHQSDDRKYLPFTPAPRWISELSFDLIRDGKVLNNTFVKVGMECNLRQNHFYSADDTETATPSYTLFSLSAGTDIRYHKHTACTVSIICDNLTNKAYQNHLSRLKYADAHPLTGRKGIFNMGRSVTFKVSVPF